MCCICRKVFSFVSYLVRMSYLSWYILVHIALQFIAIIVAGSFNKSHLSQTAVKSTYIGIFSNPMVSKQMLHDSSWLTSCLNSTAAAVSYDKSHLSDLTSADLAKSLTQNIARSHHRHPKKRGHFLLWLKL